ncbi:MAG: hypothetical protein KVP17_002515 [Porospora cf. gigantea B]|uniref:uncharacterized protein n=1 Tax=Porospora cf. gigantea B TaxID=2853592 RepID=UPI003571B9D8|nr:MAG: hypothetical protein KVP17_002515 [Porospora cf. gigantea B]
MMPGLALGLHFTERLGVALWCDDDRFECTEYPYCFAARRAEGEFTIVISAAAKAQIKGHVRAVVDATAQATLTLRPAADFLFSNAVHALLNFSSNVGASAVQRQAALKSRLDLSRTDAVAALGGVVAYARRSLESAAFSMDQIAELKIGDYMSVDVSTATDIGMFSDEKQMRERPTVLSLFQQNLCAPKISAAVLKRWVKLPLKTLGAIEHRLHTVAQLVDSDNGEVYYSFKRLSRRLSNVEPVLSKLKLQPIVKVYDFTSLIGVVEALIELEDLMSRSAVRLPFAQRLSDVVPQVKAARQVLADLDIQESLRRETPSIKPETHPELLEAYCKWKNTDGELEALVGEIWMALISDTTTLFVPQGQPMAVWMPSLGSFLAFQLTEEFNETEVAVPHASWSFEFEKDGMAFFKAPLLHDYDNVVDAILLEKQTLETRLLRDMQQRLAKFSGAISEGVAVAAEYDVHSALAKTAVDMRWCRPTLVAEPTLRLVQARHPVYEVMSSLDSSCFIPNDLDMSQSQCHLITGPNGSGKSVFLKTAAIAVYLAHLGSFVPAESATIGLVDAIVSVMEIRETATIENNSFFSTALVRVSQLLRSLTGSTLLLIDEFGKGTASCCGIGLLAALINYIGSMPSVPRCLLTTHFQEVVSLDLVKIYPAQPVDVFYMKAELNGEGDDLQFKYAVEPGIASSSYGVLCARACGIPDDVAVRASEVADAIKRRRLILPITALTSECPRSKCVDLYRAFLSADLTTPAGMQALLELVNPPDVSEGSVVSRITARTERCRARRSTPFPKNCCTQPVEAELPPSAADLRVVRSHGSLFDVTMKPDTAAAEDDITEANFVVFD